MIELTLMPAYGCKYTSDEIMLRDWYAGKYFKIYSGGPYTSIRDMNKLIEVYDRVTLTRDFLIYKVV